MTQPVLLSALVVAGLATGAIAHSNWKNLRGRGTLAADLQPEIVAHTLAQVEDDWRAQAEAFEACNASEGTKDCSMTGAAFEKSCATVVEAVVKASNGDRDVVGEYMDDVCNQKLLEGWRKGRCLSLASSVTNHMSHNAYETRVGFNTQKFCTNYWTKFADEERVRAAQDRVAQEAAEKRRAEEAKQRYEEEQAEAAKAAAKAAEEAAEEKKRADEERAKAEAAEANRQAEETQQLAEEKAKDAEITANATLEANATTVIAAANATDAEVSNATETEASNATDAAATNVNVTDVAATNATEEATNATETATSNATDAAPSNVTTAAQDNATDVNASAPVVAAPAANASAQA